MKIGLVGVGAIATKQHLPAIAADPDLTLAAAASHEGTVEGVPNFTDLDDMLAGVGDIEAVVLCVPPAPRFALARAAIAAGRHVFLEKPPGLTVAAVEILRREAAEAGVTLLASWHSRYAPAVETFAARLKATPPSRVTVEWREDVRVWHPGQAWIWEPGGFGVFDPGINALSIMTHALPDPFHLTASTLFVPQNREQPIRADLTFADTRGTPIAATFDFDHGGPPMWDIIAETEGGRYRLAKGGAQLFCDDAPVVDAPEQEYPLLYRHFADLVARRASDVDVAPLMHVADAFMAARFRPVGPFDEAVPPAS